MDLDGKLNICRTCLSSDRQLYPLTKFQSLQELSLLQINPTSASVCWECRNTIIKFCNLKIKADTAQKILSDVEHNGNMICLSTLEFSKHQPFFEFQHIYDPLTEECDEVKVIKEDIFSLDVLKDVYQEDSEQMVNADGDDILHDSETFLMSDDDQVIDVDPVNIKRNFEGDIKTENVEEKRCFTRNKKWNAKSETDNKLLDAPEEVMKKILKIELTDEEVHKQREQKRNHPNYKKLPYKCDMCVIGFTKEENFNEHVKKKHEAYILSTPDDDYSCAICKLRFSSPRLAQKHRDRHYTQYKCLLCKYETCEQWLVLSHCREKHNNDAVGRIHCNLCTMVLSTPDEYSEHLKREHSQTCGICGDKLQGKDSLRAHMRRIHSQKRDFACDNCPKTFKTKSRLESHMTTHNVNIAKKLSYCSICNVQYKNIYIYRSHLRNSANHVKERYRCSECNKEFVSKRYWKRHYKFYHLKKSEYKCDECDKLFISKWHLKDHQQKHHGLNRPRKHVCNVCGKKFYDRSLLKGHQLTHSEQRSYMCSECGDTFKQPAALYTHTKLVHKGTKKRCNKQKNINK